MLYRLELSTSQVTSRDKGIVTDLCFLVLVSLVQDKCPDDSIFYGLGSRYLQQSPSRNPSSVYVKALHAHFAPKDYLYTPIIMIAAGSGFAPFRGFLQQREVELGKSAPSISAPAEWLLFFGCRSPKEQLYPEDISRWREKQVLTRCYNAFSREEERRVYVQDLMLERQQELFTLLCEKGAQGIIIAIPFTGLIFFFSSALLVFICGDAKHMARDVYDAWIRIIGTVGNMNAESAAEHVRELEAGGRYLEDVW